MENEGKESYHSEDLERDTRIEVNETELQDLNELIAALGEEAVIVLRRHVKNELIFVLKVLDDGADRRDWDDPTNL